MGKLSRSRQDVPLNFKEAEDEDDAKWAVETACSYVNGGNFERALSLLEKAERINPNTKGLPEIIAVTEVCYAATWSPCACSLKPLQHKSPDWYQILKVSEKAHLSDIKKKYRQLALLLHPDKNKHVRAEEAFKLVSEAYAHLSDKRKRALFDLERVKRQCKRCFSVSQSQRDDQDVKKYYKERLKGRNQSNFQRWDLGTDFHTVEWSLEQEKLKMFRERAQAKVASLAQILKERRSRWNEEVGIVKRKYQNKNIDKTSLSGLENKVHKFELLDQLHELIKARNERARELDGSFQRSDYSRLSHIIEEQGFSSEIKDFLETLRRKKASQKDTPSVLQSLDGFLENLREDIGGAYSGEEHVKASENMEGMTKFTVHADAEEAESNNSNAFHKTAEESELVSKNTKGKLEEEIMVIDNFLAGLSDWPPEKHQRSSATTDLNPCFPKRSEAEEENLETISKDKCQSFTNGCVTSLSSSKKSGDAETETHVSTQQSSAVTNSCASTDISLEGFLHQGKLTQRPVSQKDLMEPPAAKQSLSNPVLDFEKTREATGSAALRALHPNVTNTCAPDHVSEISIMRSQLSTSSALVGEKGKNRPCSEKSVFGVTKVPWNDCGKRKVTLNACRKSMTEEDNIIQSQKKKSEQLLKTLERLREETKSVAATLEKLKDSVDPESRHAGVTFSGNHHVQAAAHMVAT